MLTKLIYSYSNDYASVGSYFVVVEYHNILVLFLNSTTKINGVIVTKIGILHGREKQFICSVMYAVGEVKIMVTIFISNKSYNNECMVLHCQFAVDEDHIIKLMMLIKMYKTKCEIKDRT